MSDLQQAEAGRRRAIQTAAGQSTEQERFAWFLAQTAPQVVALMHEVGRAWGGVPVGSVIDRRSLAARVLGPPPRDLVRRGYEITTLNGPFSRGNDLILSLGYLQRQDGRTVLGYRRGLEAGGLRISVGYEDATGGYFTLSATRPFLGPYYRHFYRLDVLCEALAYEWQQGTFVGPYEHYTPFHHTYPPPAQ